MFRELCTQMSLNSPTNTPHAVVRLTGVGPPMEFFSSRSSSIASFVLQQLFPFIVLLNSSQNLLPEKHVRIQYSISENLKDNRLFLNKLTPDGFSEVIEKWNDSPATVLPILRRLMDAGLRVWVYSGDTDGRVPVTSTRYSINEMRLKAKQDKTKGRKKEWGGWRAWYHKEQVAGWVVEYEEGLSLVTVRGAGHQVPIFAADRSLAIFSHFLHGRTLPAEPFDRA